MFRVACKRKTPDPFALVSKFATPCCCYSKTVRENDAQFILCDGPRWLAHRWSVSKPFEEVDLWPAPFECLALYVEFSERTLSLFDQLLAR